MGVRLSVKSRGTESGAEGPSEVILEESEITLGRDKSCNVVLNQQAVSRQHAKISKDGSLYFIEDLGSAYGTLVGGKKVPKNEKQLLRNGETISIGQFDITFDRVTEGNPAHDGTQAVARKVVKDVMKGLTAGRELPYFRIMNGPKEGERIEIADAQEITFGRDESADIILNDDLVSRRHAKVRRDWSGTHIEDLGSRNGIRVNKKRATQVTLKDRDEVEVGNVRMLYIDPTEVREAPVVLEKPKGEATAITEGKELQAMEEAKAAELAAAEEAAAAAENPPSSENAAVEGDDGAGESEEGDGEGEDEEAPEEDEAPAAPPKANLMSAQSLAFFVVVGVVGILAIAFIVLLLVGA